MPFDTEPRIDNPNIHPTTQAEINTRRIEEITTAHSDALTTTLSSQARMEDPDMTSILASDYAKYQERRAAGQTSVQPSLPSSPNLPIQ